MSNLRITLVFMLISFTLTGWTLDFGTYDELSTDIIKLGKAPTVSKIFAALPLLQKLEDLKKRSDEAELYEGLISIVKNDGGPIKLADLVLVLEAVRTNLPTDSIEESTKAKLVSLFEDLVKGHKELKNVVIVGRTRGGKSTFLATMINPLDKELHKSIANQSIFSFTVSSSHHIAIFDSVDDGLLVARLVDTPGLSEAKAMGSDVEARSDQEIIDEIAKSLKGLFLHKVIQIFPLSTGLDEADISAFKALKTVLAKENDFLGKIDLAIPRADQTTDTTLQNLIEELRSILPRSGINEADYGHIYRSGTIFNDSFKNGHLNDVLVTAPRVLRYRNNILHGIFGVPFSEGLTEETKGGKTKVYVSPSVRKKIKDIIPQRETEEKYY